MNKPLWFGLIAFAFACSVSPPASATLVYDLKFDVNAAIGATNSTVTVDATFTSDGPATETSNVISVPATISGVSVTGDPLLTTLFSAFENSINSFLQSFAGGSFTYDLNSNKVTLNPEFTFVTTSPIDVTAPFSTSGNQVFLDLGTFSTPLGDTTITSLGDIRSFSATGDPISLALAAAAPEPSTWAMIILGFCGLGFMAYRRRSTLPLTAA